MRLEGRKKGGFYPAPPAALAAELSHIKPPASGPFSVLDPCMGRGAALAQIAETLGAERSLTFGCELSESLGLAAAAALPGARLVSPADFLVLSCSFGSFSFLHTNPPFDSTLEGGDREEMAFLQRSADLLCPGGVLAFVVPEPTAERWDIQRHLMTHFRDLSAMPFPEEHRKFREVVIFGVKRDKPVQYWGHQWETECSLTPGVYRLPNSKGPTQFRKTQLTDQELLVSLADSPLRRFLTVTPEPPLARPPLSLGPGHIALLIASGQLDGLIEPKGEPPHVVRGTARKVQYQESSAEEPQDGGGTKTVTILRERIVVEVRAVDATGEFRTFTDRRESDIDPAAAPAEEQENEDGQRR